MRRAICFRTNRKFSAVDICHFRGIITTDTNTYTNTTKTNFQDDKAGISGCNSLMGTKIPVRIINSVSSTFKRNYSVLPPTQFDCPRSSGAVSDLSITTPTSTTNTSTAITTAYNAVISAAKVLLKELPNYPPPSLEAYLRTIPRSQLVSLFLVGLVTWNKTVLEICIKIFPYLPLPLVRIFVSNLYCGGETIEQTKMCGTYLQKRGISNMMLSLTVEHSEDNVNNNTSKLHSGSTDRRLVVRTNEIDDGDWVTQRTINSIHTILKPNLLSQINDDASNINEIAPGYVAIKPSALTPNAAQALRDYNYYNHNHNHNNNNNSHTTSSLSTQRQRLEDNCIRIANEIYTLNKRLKAIYPNRIAPFFLCTIDAESFALQTNGISSLQRLLFRRFNSKTEPFVSCIGTWQLYLRDCKQQLSKERQLAERHGYRLGLKLVRGAYLHTEPNRAKIIHREKLHTDAVYNETLTQIIADMYALGTDSTYGHLVVASHNYHSQLLTTKLLRRISKMENQKDDNNNNSNGTGNFGFVAKNVVIGQLLGMGDNVAFDLVENEGVRNIIKYVPWGPARETREYLLRRLRENGDAVRADSGVLLLKSIIKSLF